MQPGELLARLEACLDSLERDAASKGDSRADDVNKQCCVLVLLQQTADHACISDFIRQVSQRRKRLLCLVHRRIFPKQKSCCCSWREVLTLERWLPAASVDWHFIRPLKVSAAVPLSDIRGHRKALIGY